MSVLNLVAIDPGASGAIAVFPDARSRRFPGGVGVVKMPATLIDIRDFFVSMNFAEDDTNHVYIERVGFHQKGNSAATSVKFGKHVGSLYMAICFMGYTLIEVSVGSWQKIFKPLPVGSDPETKRARKNRILEKVQMSFPENRITLQTADAYAIMVYALHQEKIL